MAEVGTPRIAAVRAGSLDRGLYLAAAVAVCGLVIAGFWRSYFSKFFGAHSEALTGLVHVHATLMSAWIALFGTQALLIAMGRPDIHRRLGKAGFVLLALILVVAVPTTIVATRLGGSHMPGPALPGLALRYGSASAPAPCIRLGIRFFGIRASVGNVVLSYPRVAAHCSKHHETFSLKAARSRSYNGL
jgi:hypothetical protein